MIRIAGLNAQLNQFRLDNVHLDAGDGEYFVVLGPTGSGKTVLLKHIAGIHRPRGGRIFIGDTDVTDLPPERRHVGYVPQEYILFPFLNVEDNIRFGLSSSERGRPEVRERLSALARMLKLDSILQRRVNSLSGGEKQRVALARALAVNPRALLLDEPFSSLDAGFRHKLWIEMKKIHSELKTTVIHITHDLEEAFTLCDRMAVMMDGRIAQSGSRESVFYFPRTRKVAEFLGIQNIFSGRVKALSKDTDSTIIRHNGFQIIAPYKAHLHEGDIVDFCIRPQEIKVLKPGKPLRESLKDNVFSGRAIAAVPHGNSFTFYFKSNQRHCSCESFDFEISLPTYAYEKMNIAVGGGLAISLRKHAIQILEAP